MVLRDLRPQLPDMLLKPAWSLCLRVANAGWIESAPDDKEGDRRLNLVERASSDHVDVVRSSTGAWLDAATLRPRVVTVRTLGELPWCRSGTMIDAALNAGPLTGFTPVHPVEPGAVIGPFVDPPPATVLVRRPARPDEPPPPDLSHRPSPEQVEDAWAALDSQLPGIRHTRPYLSGLTVASLVTQRGDGQPGIVVVTGPTGSAKTAGQELVGAMVGRPAAGISLGESEDTFRQAGLALESGAGLLFCDEIGRLREVYHRLEPVLRLGSTITYRPKYANERTTPMTACLSFLGSTLPYEVTRSPELARRAVGYRLIHKVGDWHVHGDIRRARQHKELRAHLDVIISSIWWRLFDGGPTLEWRRLCLDEFGAVGLQELDLEDVGGEGRDRVLRSLYCHFRTAPETEFTTGDRWSGWLRASPGQPAGKLLAELVDFGADSRTVMAQASDLERVDLGPVLRFDHPMLRFKIHHRGSEWLVKFLQLGVQRGRELSRDQLPPVGPSGDEDPPPTGGNGSREAGIHPEAEDRAHPAGGDARASGNTASRRSRTVTPPDTQPRTSGNDRLRTLRTCPNKELSETHPPVTRGVQSELPGLNPCVTCVSCEHSDAAAPTRLRNSPDSGVATSSYANQPAIIDFETRSAVSLPKLGGRTYAAHPSTEAVCLVACLPDGSWVDWTAGRPPPPALIRVLEEGVPVAANNVLGFDRFIWQQLGWPAPRAWVDTSHLARLAGLPAGLENMGSVLFGRGKDLEGRNLTLSLSRLDRGTGKLPPLDGQTLERVVAYCHRDVELLVDAWRKVLHRFTSTEQQVRDTDLTINGRGFRFDADLARAIISMEERVAVEAARAAPVSGTVLASPAKLRRWLAEAGIIVPNAKRDTLLGLLEDDDLADDVRHVLVARISSSGVAVHKLRTALSRLSPDGRLRDTLAYHAAHTGRWGGRGIQPQNLPRGIDGLPLDEAVSAALNGDLAHIRGLAEATGSTVNDVLATLVRQCIVAPDGKHLVAIDFSSVEARGLLWLAGDEEGLAPFRANRDSYKITASRIYGVTVEEVSKGQRQLGKSTDLGCGYRMGPPHFRGYAESYGVDWSTAPVTPEQVVQLWRDMHPLVAGHPTGERFKGHVVCRGGLWRDLEDVAARAIRSGGAVQVARVTFEYSEGDLACHLPSGRKMIYRDARLEPVPTPWGATRQGMTYHSGSTRVSTHGGQLAANITQALCRDLLAEGLVRLEQAGIPVVLHVHDEVVCEVGDERQFEQVKDLLVAVPAWAGGLPLAADGYVARRYRK
jgi:DNA polymerase